MNALVAAWSEWVFAMSSQLVVLAALVVLFERALGRRLWPGLALALWSLVALKLLVPPWLASPVSLSRLVLAPEVVVAATPSVPAPLLVAAFWTWLLGALVFITTALVRHRRARRTLLGDPRPVPARVRAAYRRAAERLGATRVPELVVVARPVSPCLVGLFAPCIVVPRRLTDRALANDLDHVLLHELAHAKRGDPWHACFVLVVRSLYWFHPVAGWLSRRLATLRELCCDRTVVRALHTEAAGYRATLARQAATILAPQGLGSHAFGHAGSSLLVRLRALATPEPRSRAPRLVLGTAIVLLFTVCCVPLARATLLPSLDEARGCLQRRLLVLAELARSEGGAPAPDPGPTR